MTERESATTIHGNPLTVCGDVLNVGDKAPEFVLRDKDQKWVKLSDSAGHVRLISVVPSLDTPVCATQTRRFNEESAMLPADVEVITVSGEHPINQGRWCAGEGIDRIQVLSDHYDMNFGNAYGLNIKDWRLLQRAVMVIGKNDTVEYIEYVPEVSDEPDYDMALAMTMQATLK